MSYKIKHNDRWPVNYPHKGQWRGALIFSFIFAWTNGCANNRDAGDLRRHRAHYDVVVMLFHYHCIRKTWLVLWKEPVYSTRHIICDTSALTQNSYYIYVIWYFNSEAFPWEYKTHEVVNIKVITRSCLTSRVRLGKCEVKEFALVKSLKTPTLQFKIW